MASGVIPEKPALAEALGQAEIGDLHGRQPLWPLHQKIGRLEISVDDTQIVCVAQSFQRVGDHRAGENNPLESESRIQQRTEVDRRDVIP